MNILKNKTTCAILLLSMVIFSLTGCSSDNDKTDKTTEKTLTEKLLGKWHFVESQEMKDGQWVKTELASPDAATEEFREDGVMAISYTYQGETDEYEIKWTLDDTTGELKAYDEENTSIGTVSFSEDGNTLYIFYTNFKHLDKPGVVSTGEYRDVLARDKASE